MAQDTTIGHGAPGVAMFATQSYGGPSEVRFGDTSVTTSTMPVVGPAGGLNLPIYSAVAIAADGVITLANAPAGEGVNAVAYGILGHPLVMAAGEAGDVEIIRTGHFDLDQINFGAAYNTDALKRDAFIGSASPGILLSKKKYNNDQINV